VKKERQNYGVKRDDINKNRNKLQKKRMQREIYMKFWNDSQTFLIVKSHTHTIYTHYISTSWNLLTFYVC